MKVIFNLRGRNLVKVGASLTSLPGCNAFQLRKPMILILYSSYLLLQNK